MAATSLPRRVERLYEDWDRRDDATLSSWSPQSENSGDGHPPLDTAGRIERAMKQLFYCIVVFRPLLPVDLSRFGTNVFIGRDEVLFRLLGHHSAGGVGPVVPVRVA